MYRAATHKNQMGIKIRLKNSFLLLVLESNTSKELFQGWRTEHVGCTSFRSVGRNVKLIFDKPL